MRPIQPLSEDENGVIRFEENSIVQFLLRTGKHDMNDIAIGDFSQEDREQFAQLIGYSLSGFGELDYVSDEAYDTADIMLKGKTELESRNEALSNQLDGVRKGLKIAVPNVFKIHPDDMEP